MNKLRQRIPFKFSENAEDEDNRILDEQEQEEVIQNLRQENNSFIQHYYKFLQGSLSFSIILQCWFLVSAHQETPFHILLPDLKKPLPSLIPFATGFTLLNIFVLLNVILQLPKDLSFPRVLRSLVGGVASLLPPNGQAILRNKIPLSVRWSASFLCIAPFVSVFCVVDLPQMMWWVCPLVILGLFVLVESWIREAVAEVEELEKMKYEAKGA